MPQTPGLHLRSCPRPLEPDAARNVMPPDLSPGKPGLPVSPVLHEARHAWPLPKGSSFVVPDWAAPRRLTLRSVAQGPVSMPMAQKTPSSLCPIHPWSPGSSPTTSRRFGLSPSCPVTAPPQPWGHSCQERWPRTGLIAPPGMGSHRRLWDLVGLSQTDALG